MFISSVSSATSRISASVYIIKANHIYVSRLSREVLVIFVQLKESYSIDIFSQKHQVRNFKKTYRTYVALVMRAYEHDKFSSCFS
jgi:hypothetical protein